jgi:hypothetical protein
MSRVVRHQKLLDCSSPQQAVNKMPIRSDLAVLRRRIENKNDDLSRRVRLLPHNLSRKIEASKRKAIGFLKSIGNPGAGGSESAVSRKKAFDDVVVSSPEAAPLPVKYFSEVESSVSVDADDFSEAGAPVSIGLEEASGICGEPDATATKISLATATDEIRDEYDARLSRTAGETTGESRNRILSHLESVQCKAELLDAASKATDRFKTSSGTGTDEVSYLVCLYQLEKALTSLSWRDRGMSEEKARIAMKALQDFEGQ